MLAKISFFLKRGYVLYFAAFLVLLFLVDYKKVAAKTLDAYRVRLPASLIQIAKGDVKQQRSVIRRGVYYYRNYTFLQPQSAVAFSALGFCYYYLGKYDAALKSYIKARQLNPNLLGISYNIGVVYVRKGDIKKAIAAFNKAVSISPEDVVLELTVSPYQERYKELIDLLKGVYIESYRYLYWCYDKLGDQKEMYRIQQISSSSFPKGDFLKRDMSNKGNEELPLFFHVPVKVFRVDGKQYKMM